MLSVNDKLSNADGIGIGRKGTIDKPQFLKAPFWTVDTLFYLTSLPNYHILFLYYLSQNINWKKFDESTGVPSLSKKTIESIVKFTPYLEEQEALGLMLKRIDDVIELHQRKINILKSLKQELIIKMFSNIREKPEVRFNEFKESWQSSNLGNLLKEFNNKSKREDEYKVFSSTNSGMEMRSGRVSGSSNKGYKIINIGDLVLSPQNLWLGNININKLGIGLVSPSYKTFQIKEVDANFLKPQFRTRRMLHKYKNASTQGASVVRRNLDMNLFYQIKIKEPGINEKNQIGYFFNQFDNQLNLQSQKLYTLQELKKSYLRKMFL